MVLCSSNGEKVELLVAPEESKPGDRISFGDNKVRWRLFSSLRNRDFSQISSLLLYRLFQMQLLTRRRRIMFGMERAQSPRLYRRIWELMEMELSDGRYVEIYVRRMRKLWGDTTFQNQFFSRTYRCTSLERTSLPQHSAMSQSVEWEHFDLLLRVREYCWCSLSKLGVHMYEGCWKHAWAIFPRNVSFNAHKFSRPRSLLKFIQSVRLIVGTHNL